MAHFYATCMKVAVNKLAALRMRTTLRDPMRSRIGMFHAIVPDDAPLPDEYACSISELMRKLDALMARGFRFVSLHALLAMPFSEAAHGYCVLTFDDGFSGVCDLAVPCLMERNIPFSLYVTTGYLNTDGYLSCAQLRELSRNPLCTIGSHLVTHPMTRFLPAADVYAEMTESKRTLEAISERPVVDLAFPYGSAYACSYRDMRLAKRAGYKSAALTTPTVLCRRLQRTFTLPRLNMFQV